MKKLLITVSAALTLAGSAFAEGWTTVFVNGQMYQVYDNGEGWHSVYGPNGNNYQAYVVPNESWTTTNHHHPHHHN